MSRREVPLARAEVWVPAGTGAQRSTGFLGPRHAAAQGSVLWACLAVVVVAAVRHPELRAGLEAWAACLVLLVAWVLTALTRSLSWRAVGLVFAAGVPWAVAIGALSAALARGAGGSGAAGPTVALAAFGEETLVLVPLAVVVAAVPARARSFAAADWLLLGLASGLALQAVEELTRRLALDAGAGLPAGYLALVDGADAGAGATPSFGVSLFAGGARLGDSWYAGHHIAAGLTAGAVGLGVSAWQWAARLDPSGSGRRAATAARVSALVGPPLMWWVTVCDHAGFNATVVWGKGWITAPTGVPAVMRWTWSAFGHGGGRGWFLVAVLVAVLLTDAAHLRRTRRVDPGLDLAPPVPWSPTEAVWRWWRRDGRPGTAWQLAAYLWATSARDVLVSVLARTRDRPDRRASPATDAVRRAAVAVRRADASDTLVLLARAEALAAPADARADARWRRVAVALITTGPALALGFGSATAAAVATGTAPAAGGQWLAGRLSVAGSWWGDLGAPDRVFALVGAVALLALSTGLPGTHPVPVEVPERQGPPVATGSRRSLRMVPRPERGPVAGVARTAGGYLLTRTPIGAVADAVTVACGLVPRDLAGPAAGAAVRRSAAQYALDPQGWTVRRRVELRGDRRRGRQRPVTVGLPRAAGGHLVATTSPPPQAGARVAVLVQGRVPASWRERSTRLGTGRRWGDPADQGNAVRLGMADPASPLPVLRVDHVVVRADGHLVGRDGLVVPAPLPAQPSLAHVPLAEWRRWRTWRQP